MLLNYKTVLEKATEWNVSPRYIQNLCKKKKINGAVKTAGAWFIPDDAPMPIKNTKSNAEHFHFVGRKKKIFESAIKLFMSKGFQTVTMRDIADLAGITQSSLYNHFTSKQEMLDTIYDFYCYYHHKDRPSLESIEPILHSGSLMDIMTSFRYEYDAEYIPNLRDITKIIMQRNSIDERAREITKSLLIDSGVERVEAVFNRAVEIGRLAPLDAHEMAIFIQSVRIFTLHIWIIDSTPKNNMKVTQDEMELYRYATKLLTDLKPPDKALDKTSGIIAEMPYEFKESNRENFSEMLK